MKENEFICLLGIDGSGKTSIIKHCREVLGLDFYVASWKDFYNCLHGITDLFPAVDSTAKLNAMHSIMRSSCLTILMSLLYDFGIKPQLGKPIVVDSYYYKFYAKEKLYRKAESWFFQAMESLIPPDLVIYLDINPSIACHRKQGEILRYEYLKKPDDFVEFQNNVAMISLEEASRRSKVLKIHVGDKSIHEVSDEFVGLLKKERGWLK